MPHDEALRQDEDMSETKAAMRELGKASQRLLDEQVRIMRNFGRALNSAMREAERRRAALSAQSERAKVER